MSNPGGVNQLGSDRVPYGEAKRLKELSSEAPMSGAPLATTALATPERARRTPASSPTRAPAPAEAPIPPAPLEQPQIPTGELYSSIAAIPGASQTVQEIFGGAGGPQ